jgi:hypothetical protein
MDRRPASERSNIPSRLTLVVPHKPIPANAPQLPAEAYTGGAPAPVDQATGRKFAWTKVQGTAVADTQNEVGGGKGQPIWRVTADCPKCSDTISLTATQAHGDAPVRCYCSMSRVFLVTW